MELFEGDVIKYTNNDVKVTVNHPCYGLNSFSGNIQIGTQTWIDHKQLLLRVIFT